MSRYSFDVKVRLTGQDVEDFLALHTRRVSTWAYVEDGTLADTFRVVYDQPGEDEGSYTGDTEVNYLALATAIGVAIEEFPEGLCCAGELVAGEVGLACSQDFDAVLQVAMFGDLVYG